MKSLSRLVAPLALPIALTAVVLAQAPNLDVRMGLWEITSSTTMGGQMPGIDTSKMTPEQQARVAAAMQSAMQSMGARTNVTKSCMTKDKFDQSNFMSAEKGMACTQTMTTNTRSALDATVVCTGQHPMTAQTHVEAASPTAFKATVKSVNTEQGKTMTVNVAMTGKWLSADCGDVK